MKAALIQRDLVQLLCAQPKIPGRPLHGATAELNSNATSVPVEKGLTQLCHHMPRTASSRQSFHHGESDGRFLVLHSKLRACRVAANVVQGSNQS